jgi:uncharacterized membrane protein
MKQATLGRRLSIFFAVGASMLTAIAAAQTPTFAIKALANIPGGTLISVWGINSAGEAVGMVGGGTSICPMGCPAVWSNGVPTPLGPVAGVFGTPPLSINNAGQVVGQIYSGTSVAEAIVWNNGTPTELPLPGPQYTSSLVSHINDAGQAVGSVSSANGGPALPTVWDGLSPTVLGLVSPYPSGVAMGINDSGLVVGTICCTKETDNSAVVWHGTTSTGLPKLENFTGTQAFAVNSSGVVVGMGGAPKESGQVAIAWANHVATNLVGTARSGATALNDRGIIVGFIGAVGAEQAVLWSRIGANVEYLSALINSSVTDKIVLTEATGINNNCVIVANGYNKKTNANNAFVLTLSDQSKCVNGGL